MSTSKVYFEEFVLDIEEGLLFAGEERVPIRPQAMRVLMKLVERNGELILRRELTSGIWADDRIDEHQGLNAIIRHLRSALGDDPASPRYIETIPRKGYRFVAKCSSHPPAIGSRRQPWATTRIVAVVASLVVVAIATSVIQLSDESRPLDIDSIPKPARQAYVEGLQKFTQGDLSASQKDFEKAVAIAPDFAEAHLRLGQSVLAMHGTNLESAVRAEPHLLEALRLNPSMPSVYVALGRVSIVKNLDADEGAEFALRALNLDPDDIAAMELLLDIRVAMRDSVGAVELLKDLDSLDPLRVANTATRGWVLMLSGDPEGAALACRDSVRVDSQNEYAIYCLFEAYYALDALELAHRQAVELLKAYGATDEHIEYVRDVDPEEGIDRFFYWRLVQVTQRAAQGGDPYPLILTNWRLGNKGEAIAQLDNFVKERRYDSIIRMSGDSRLDRISAETGQQIALIPRNPEAALQ